MDLRQWLASIDSFTEEERQVLEQHAAKQQEETYTLRWMHPSESMELMEQFASIPVYQNLIPLWDDRESNYVALYREGPLAGKVCLLQHDETDLTPGFRSVFSFLERVKEDVEQDWYELPKDYPTSLHVTEEQMVHDKRIVEQLWQQWEQEEQHEDEDIRCQAAFALIAMTPADTLHMLLPLLDDEDMYVQERACERFGQERFEAAREKLQHIASSGMPNGRTAAKRALKRMQGG